MDITEFLIFAVNNKASDLHLSAGEPPNVRIHGEMRKFETPILGKEEIHDMIYDILSDAQRKTYEEHLEIDFSFSLGEYGRFRVNVFKQNRGDAAVFRTIPGEIPSFESLGLPKVLVDLCRLEKGLVLVTGPTGSGKSTTLAAMVDLINTGAQGPYHHHRGPHRVRPYQQELPRQPEGAGAPYAQLRKRPEERPPGRP